MSTLITVFCCILSLVAGGAIVAIMQMPEGKSKLQLAVTAAEQVIKILIAIYANCPDIAARADEIGAEIAAQFKKYLCKLGNFTDEEISTLWKMSAVTIVDELKKHGIEVTIDAEFDFKAIPINPEKLTFKGVC